MLGSWCSIAKTSRHSRTYLTGLDVTHLQGHLCQLDTPYQIRQNSHSVNKDKSELQFVDLPYVSVTIVSDETYCRNLQHIKSTSNEIVGLAFRLLYSPLLTRNLDMFEEIRFPYPGCCFTRCHRGDNYISLIRSRSKHPQSTSPARRFRRYCWP